MNGHWKPAVFNLLTIFLGVFLSATFLPQAALSSPIAGTTSLELRDLVKRYSGSPSGKIGDGGPDTSDYPSDQDIADKFIKPSGPFVFFSGIQDSQAPYNFAESLKNGAKILRGAFPKGYITQGKPKKSSEWLQDFFDRVSGFYADQAVKAGADIYFVGKFDASFNECSIWSRIELQTLIDGGITKVTLVDYSNPANHKDYPLPISDILPREEDGMLRKRQNYCFDWQGDREDPADPESDPLIRLDYYPGNCGIHLQQVSLNLF